MAPTTAKLRAVAIYVGIIALVAASIGLALWLTA
jgi:hypothetical protein